MEKDKDNAYQKSYNSVYDRLVGDGQNFTNQIEYAIYKKCKKDYVVQKKHELNIDGRLPDEELKVFTDMQTDMQLEFYRREAADIVFLTMDNFRKKLIDDEVNRMEKEYRLKYIELLTSLKPKGWFCGFWQ